MSRMWWATLTASSPRYAEWWEILRSNDIPLANPQERTFCLGNEQTSGYVLRADDLRADQLDRYVQRLAAKFAVPAEDILADLEAHGGLIPVRGEDVCIAFSLKAVL